MSSSWRFPEVIGNSLGTVKSCLMRGRDALRKRFHKFVDELNPESGIGSDRRTSCFRALLAVTVLSAVLMPAAGFAQNLGRAPAVGQAVQGQNAAQVEGTILNIVNWTANVICPTIAGLFVVATIIAWKSQRPWLPTAATAIGLLCVSAILRLIEYFIQNGTAVGYVIHNSRILC